MNIHGVGTSIPQHRNVGRGAGASTNPAPASDTTLASEAGKTKGVVRLLQEGHFKGVADLRLRINFQDEIAQLGSQAVSEGFSDSLQAFFNGVVQGFDSFIEGVSATEEQAASATALFDGFKSSINDLADAFLNGGGTDFGSVAIQFQTNFDNFIIELQSLLEPAPADVPPPAPEAADVPAPPDAEIPQVDNSFLDEFRATFAEQLSQLLQSIQDSASVLPELSAPNGNGAAYAKFLEILEGINAPAPDAVADSIFPEILA